MRARANVACMRKRLIYKVASHGVQTLIEVNELKKAKNALIKKVDVKNSMLPNNCILMSI